MAASNFSWAAPGSWTNCFGASDLNSLANITTVFSTGSTLDTTTTRELYVQFEFTGGSISPTAPADVVIFCLPRTSDGSTYVDGEASGTAANQPIWMQVPHAVIGLRGKATSTQLEMSMPVLLFPNVYKFGLLNRAGVSLAASGNQVKYRLLTQAVG